MPRLFLGWGEICQKKNKKKSVPRNCLHSAHCKRGRHHTKFGVIPGDWTVPRGVDQRAFEARKKSNVFSMEKRSRKRFGLVDKTAQEFLDHWPQKFSYHGLTSNQLNKSVK